MAGGCASCILVASSLPPCSLGYCFMPGVKGGKKRGEGGVPGESGVRGGGEAGLRWAQGRSCGWKGRGLMGSMGTPWGQPTQAGPACTGGIWLCPPGSCQAPACLQQLAGVGGSHLCGPGKMRYINANFPLSAASSFSSYQCSAVSPIFHTLRLCSLSGRILLPMALAGWQLEKFKSQDADRPTQQVHPGGMGAGRLTQGQGLG